MESLNMYGSDGESDSSSSLMVPRKSAASSEEADANCEPITMDLSEDSSNGHSDNEQRGSSKSKRQYSKSLSPSPTTSYSSDSSENNKRSNRVQDEDSKIDSSKDRRYDDYRRDDDRRSKYDKDHRLEDDEKDRRRRDDRRDRRRDRDTDRFNSKKFERKRYRSRSRSSSRGRHKSYRQKNRSRSRSRSYDRYQRRNIPSKSSTGSSRRRSPYRSRRSRSRSRSRDKPRPKNWKSTSKLKVLEKLGIELKVPPVAVDAPQTGMNPTAANTSSQLTPQMLLQKTMEAQVEKVKTATGIALPAYYNPMAINPSKYAEQIQKRRLLWGNKDKQAVNPPPVENNGNNSADKSGGTIWQGATFGGDQDGKMTAKFQRLMGIKNPVAAAVPEPKNDGSDLIKKQEEMFNSMENQYEVARLATHTHRGVGLGFGTFQPR